MKCELCNANLSDFEATMRHAITKQFVNTCSQCLTAMGDVIPLQVRNDLLSDNDIGNVDSLWDEAEACIEENNEDMDGLDDYWSER